MPLQTLRGWAKHFIKFRVLHVDDTPHRIALAVGISIFVTWTPAIGLQMISVLLLCTLVRANKFVGLPFVWISNPLTAVPIYAPNYFVGRWILGSEAKDVDWTAAFRAGEGGWLARLVGRIQSWWSLTIDVFWPLWVGSIVVGLLLGVASYLLVYYCVVYYRRKRPHLRLRLPLPLRHRRKLRTSARSAKPPQVDQADPDAADRP
ncbi:MAG: DUF2062 domain-containing protein [Planctomycetota bacterium]|jgi:uncharacterized protein (DUF2062 family)